MTDVSVVSPEDVNADGTVDIKDVYKTAQTYSSDPSLPNWSSNCDINNDNQVEMKDYYMVCKNYGKTEP